jgi:hypothetical protein
MAHIPIFAREDRMKTQTGVKAGPEIVNEPPT